MLSSHDVQTAILSDDEQSSIFNHPHNMWKLF